MRRTFVAAWRRLLGPALAGVLVAGLASSAGAESVLRLVPQADLKILDTVQTTNNITSNHGYMIYDTLFSLDSKLDAEAADGRQLHEDRRRPHLEVQAAPRPQVPRRPAGDSRRMCRVDPALLEADPGRRDDDAVHEGDRGRPGRHVRDPVSNKPFGLVLETLAGPENPLFITREADALTRLRTPRSPTAIGSGPFMFVREEWVPGSKVVYKKNPDYKPRIRPARRFRRRASSPRSIASSGS